MTSGRPEAQAVDGAIVDGGAPEPRSGSAEAVTLPALCMMCENDTHPGSLMHNERCECPCRQWNIGSVPGFSLLQVVLSMSIPLRIVERVEGKSGYAYEAGEMFPCWNTTGAHEIEGRGPCWVVRLPGAGYLWHTNMESSQGGFWTVTGEPPDITVQPSINVGPELWHGFITNGALSPDTDSEGKK